MCGFAGVVVWDERYRVTRETLQKMSARIAHRGPDGEGIYLSPDAPIIPNRPQVALAHRRLAILDPDPRANQPFTDNAGRWLVFNGEIYNFRDLRAELSRLQPAYEWRTSGDTEVLLLAYDQWGAECVERLNGMFAFAVWDAPKKQLFLARDRMGQKPLYYAVLNRDGSSRALHQPDSVSCGLGAIAFASELGALQPLRWIERSINEQSLVTYLHLGYLDGTTIYRGIGQLQPWTAVVVQSSTGASQSKHRYGEEQSPPPNPISAADSVASTRNLVEQAVRRQLVSDVPLGCFLSGGIDSSIVAAAMRKSQATVETFSIGFDDARYDERAYAAAVAKHLGTRHHEFCVRPNAAEDLPKLAAVFGEPFADSSALPTHYLSRETRGCVKVALSGDGSDELFGGYERYRAMRVGERLRRLPAPVLKLMTGSSALLPGVHPKSKMARLKRFAVSLDEPPYRRYFRYVCLFDETAVAQLLAGNLIDRAGGNRELMSSFRDSFVDRDVVRGAINFDLTRYLPGDLLTKVDRASMLHALEVRSPFMDHELVRFAGALTTDQLLKGGSKRMLREAFARDLPAWVFKRRKMGFAVPIGEWFRGELRSMLRDSLFAADSFASQYFNRPVVERLVQEHESQRADHSQRLYALLMLELWWRARNG